MKKLYLLFFICLFFGLILQAQNIKTIDVIAGSLNTSLTYNERNTITDLTLTGTIDARDFKTMRDLMPHLAKLDLRDVTIAAYSGNEGTGIYGVFGSKIYLANRIPECAFYKDIIAKGLTTIIFPQTITSIGSDAFYNCVGLTDILIPSKVTSIEKEAFYNCNGLKSVFLPSSVISLGSQSFKDCNKLTSITLNCSVPPDLIFSSDVFYHLNKSLCVLNVPFKSVRNYRIANQWSEFQYINEAINGFNVSSNNVRMNEMAASKAIITISSNIEWTASSDQDWLVVNPTSGNGLSQTLTFTAEENPAFMYTRTAYITVSAPGVEPQTITVTQSNKMQPPKTFVVTSGGLESALSVEELATITDLTLTGTIDARDFKTMRDKMPLLAKLNLSGVNIVAYNGSEGTSDIGNVNYPANTIPQFAFVTTIDGLKGKRSLTSIVLPESLNAISNYSFALCISLTNVIIPSSVTNIGSSALYGCSKISEITIPPAVSTIGSQALGRLSSTINVDADNLNYMSSNNVIFDKTQTRLIQCSALNSGSYEIPSTVTTIDNDAFYDCEFLTSVIIPSSVTSIGKYAFYWCTSLSTLTIPSSVTFIGGSAFAFCQGLRTIYAFSTIPVNLTSSPDVFYPSYMSCPLYVPIGSKNAYQTANQWEDFHNIIEFNPNLIANAGPDKEIDEGTLGMLVGSASVNTNGNPLTYQWTAPEEITLSSDILATPTFIAPKVTKDTCFTFSLIISDGLNYSAAVQVVITVKNVNKPPVANAGPDQTVNERIQVNLDGSASFDPNNNYLSYQWTIPSGIKLNSNSLSKPAFVAPEVKTDTDFIFVLWVNNGFYYRTDTVVITVKQVNQTNRAPIANAGNEQYTSKGATVTLDGTSSMDPDADALTYLWTAPDGITLSSTTSDRPYFTVPYGITEATYTFSLVVNDGKINSTTSKVRVIVKNVNPTLDLITRVNNPIMPVYLNYKLFMKDGNSFIQKIDTFAITGDTIHLYIEPGDWIALVSPARDPSAFIPTYVGNVLNWNEAEIINMLDKSVIYREITCIMTEPAKTGVGQISGFVYVKKDGLTNSITITKTNNTASNPIQNALVRLYKKGSAIPVYSVNTDSQGAYNFDKLEIADYEIVVELPGYIQSDKFTIALSTEEPMASAYFGVDTSTKVITDNNPVQVSIINLYPKPTNGIIQISGLPENVENRISIYTIDGKLVMEKKTHLNSETIDISDQPYGTYIVLVNKERFKILKK